jgi:hypothetical protein
MGIRFSFFKTPQHKVFNYTPIYYDERKERMQERLDAIEREKAEKEGREYKSERYIPGKHIKGKMHSALENNRHSSMSPSLSRVVGLISVGILFVMIYYFANYFGWFMNVL